MEKKKQKHELENTNNLIPLGEVEKLLEEQEAQILQNLKFR